MSLPSSLSGVNIMYLKVSVIFSTRLPLNFIKEPWKNRQSQNNRRGLRDSKPKIEYFKWKDPAIKVKCQSSRIHIECLLDRASL